MTLDFIEKIYNFLYFKSWQFGFWQPSDRRFLKEVIFPFFSSKAEIKKILFVGVHSYTKDYEQFFSGKYFKTIDCDPNMKKFGSANHETIDFCNFTEKDFDLVILNGVIGYGLNEISQVRQAAEIASSILKHDGWFVLGNSQKLFIKEYETLFLKNMSYQNFPATGKKWHHFSFPYSTAVHEYRFLQLNKGDL